MTTAYQEITDEQIARRAYELWVARGCPEGDGSEDWEAAEAELRGELNGDSETSGIWTWWCRLRQKITGRDM